MAQKRTTKESVSRKSSGFNDTHNQSTVGWEYLDAEEQLSVICDLFIVKQKRMSEIAKEINHIYGANLKREAIYPLIMKAIKKGRIQYVPSQEQQLERQLKNQYNWLFNTKVVHSNQFHDIACYGAEMLLDLLKNYRHPNKEVHIGFAGGHAMRILANQFAKLLENSENTIPQKLVLHALVAGFDVHEPTTDPNTFFTLFHTNNSNQLEFSFVGLHALPLVGSADFPDIIQQPGVVESFDEAGKIDIIVTSATCWDDEHSTFRKFMSKSPDCFEILNKEGCIGDMLWLPLGDKHPINPNKTKTRGMTLFELDQLSGLIKKGTNVLLILGPCAHCQKTKTSVLKAILDQDKQLITHLVTDSRSVREIIKS